jgi:hypothetical protein
MQSLILVGDPDLSLSRLRPLLPREWMQYFIREDAAAHVLRFQAPRPEAWTPAFAHDLLHDDAERSRRARAHQGRDWFIHLGEWIDRREHAEEDYRTNDDLDAEFREALGGRSFFPVRFNDYTVLRSLLPSLLRALPGRLDTYWIDNDYGVVLRADRFLAKLEGAPAWDWRTREP